MILGCCIPDSRKSLSPVSRTQALELTAARRIERSLTNVTNLLLQINSFFRHRNNFYGQ